ncbi:MAG: response regulator, partial [Spirochaetota bacterium]
GSGQTPEETTARDPVTGLRAEDAFHNELEEASRERFEGSAEAGADEAVLLLGVDNIERINRRYGRTGGDDALHSIAYLLRNYQSAHDPGETHQIYKLNGPRFAYRIAGASLQEGSRVAEQLRQIVAESAMFLEQMSVSVGVASAEEVEEGQADASPKELAGRLYERAQARLHVARSGGMNTVCSTDPEGARGLGAGATILIADPDAPYLEILTRQLDELGYSVIVADDGEDALEIIDQIVPDAIICEAMLPKVNGFAIREELRHSSRLSEIPFILISHRKNDESINKAALLGIVHFLRKPFSLVELTGLLRNTTGARQE